MSETNNPYQPPSSDLVTGVAETNEPYFFTTSPLKFALMSLCTFGFYELYWFYCNWWLIKGRTGQAIMPFWRAFFALFWVYSLFKHIKTSAIEHNIATTLPIGWLAFVYFILQLLWQLPDPIWLVSVFSFAILMPANTLALKVNQHMATNSDTDTVNDNFKNETFTLWNWLGLIVGGILWVLVLIGLFMPPS